MVYNKKIPSLENAPLESWSNKDVFLVRNAERVWFYNGFISALKHYPVYLKIRLGTVKF